MFEDILSLFDYPFVFDVYLLIALAMFLFYCKTMVGGDDDIPWYLNTIRWLAIAISGSILWPVIFCSWIIKRFWCWSVSV